MKPSLPQGTKDFSAATVHKRSYIISTIKKVFELYGFQPLETPAMENLETLLGKYGDEGDKLIFRILDSGNPFSKDFLGNFFGFIDELSSDSELLAQQDKLITDFFIDLANYLKRAFERIEEIKTIPGFASTDNPYANPLWKLNPEYLQSVSKELLNNNKYINYLSILKNDTSTKALRYDLTIPFARYVAMNYGQLSFPFKRYQIQPVWRADRPQKGRYREFYQCDADVVGSNSLLNEVELANIYAAVFKALNIDVEIKINSRKILLALAEICGGADKMMDITVAIDKLDKIGIEKVKEELLQRNLNEEQIAIIEKYLLINGNSEEKTNVLKALLGNNESGKKGIDEIEFILNYIPGNKNIVPDFTLARGLNYYTGIIFEIKAKNVVMGSIGGGGRYDDLTGLFGVPNLPGVGISFGVDRIYDVMEELKLFPETVSERTKVLFFNLGEAESKNAYTLMQLLRTKNISCEIFTETAKLGKQFQYAERKNINYVVIIGDEEMKNQTCTIKNIVSGDQQTIAQQELSTYNF